MRDKGRFPRPCHKCLSLITTHYQQYNTGITKRTKCNTFWVINNSMEVLQMLDKLNKDNKPKCFDGFDFSTLYTNIPHCLLLNCMFKLF